MITTALIEAVLGKPAHVGQDTPTAFSQFCIDTRSLKADELFFAIKGETRDGHDFLGDAATKCAAAIVEQVNPTLSITQWQVPDVTLAMGDLAHALRQQHKHIPLVAITGSCGKTTTSHLVAHICQLAGKTLASRKSFNNQWGVPITLSNLVGDDQYIIQEMGANHQQEISYLTKLAQPNVAAITLIAPVHLEGFGSLDGVAQGKSEIFQGLVPGGTAIINADDPYAALQKSHLDASHSVISFGLKAQADIMLVAEPEFVAMHTAFQLQIFQQTYAVKLPLLGMHNVANALAAVACAKAVGIADAIIIEGLATASAPDRRLVKKQSSHGWMILDDSYNANPVAMKMAFQSLSREPGRKVAVLGDMGECGAQAQAFHQQLAHDLLDNHIDVVFSTGDLMQYLDQEATKLGLTSHYCPEQKDLIACLMAHLAPQDHVLVKGSNSMNLQSVVQAIL